MSNTTLEIIQGLSQAAANAYDGAHDERYSYDGQSRSMGLRREEGCPIMDSRVMDGFKVRFYGDSMILSYQSDILLKEVYSGNFEQDIESMLNDIKKFLQKEYRAITGEPSVDQTRDVTRKFLEQFKDNKKRPQNDTRKKGANQKKA